MSRVFTIKLRTYKVCFDCGREFDLPSIPAPTRSDVRANSTTRSGMQKGSPAF